MNSNHYFIDLKNMLLNIIIRRLYILIYIRHSVWKLKQSDPNKRGLVEINVHSILNEIVF